MDCPDTLKNNQEQLNSIMSQAKQFAIKSQQNVFIYNEEGTLRFIGEEAGRKAGIQPTHGAISYLQPVTA